MMEDLWAFICACLAVVGGYAIVLAMIRIIIWLTDVILLGGW